MSSESCLKIFGYGYGTLIILGCAVSTIVSAVYGLIGIINVSHDRVQEICPNSNLWVYVLINVIIVLANLLVQSKKNEKSDGTCSLICCLFEVIGLFIWGGIEIFDIAEDCDTLHHKKIYLSAFMTFSIYLIMLVNIFLILLGGLAALIYEKMYENKNNRNTNNTVVEKMDVSGV